MKEFLSYNKEVITFLAGLIIIGIIGAIYHHFDQKKWRKKLYYGNTCHIRSGSSRIKNCTVLHDLEDKVVVRDPWDHVRTISKKDVFKPL
jgi:hypothetical protein